MLWDALGRSGMHWDALGCSRMHWDALGCTGMHWDALGCSTYKITEHTLIVTDSASSPSMVNIFKHPVVCLRCKSDKKQSVCFKEESFEENLFSGC